MRNFLRSVFYAMAAISFGATAGFAQVVVDVKSQSWSEGRAEFDLSFSNKSEKGISGARVWVFLMSDDGKVVGNHAEWIIGGKAKKQEEDNSIAAGEEREVSFSFKNEQPFTEARVIFSRMIDSDGRVMNLRKEVQVNPIPEQ